MKNTTDTASFESNDDFEQSDDITKPIGVGAFTSESNALPGETIGKPSLKLRSSSIVLGLVVVMAIIGLFSMRTLARVTASVVGNQEMDRVIDDFMNSSAGRNVFQLTSPTNTSVEQSNEVLAVLNEAYSERQVPLTNVQKDPFLILDQANHDEPKATTDNKAGDLKRMRAERRQQLSNIANRLSLKSVMLGAVPLANINGQIVRPGEIITINPEHQEFEVMSIEADTVRLSTSDLTLGVHIEVEIGINRDQTSGRKR